MFLLYATHIIYHADVKFPTAEEKDDELEKNDSVPPPYEKATSAYRRRNRSNSPASINGAIPLYEVKKISNFDRKPKYLRPAPKYGDGRKLHKRKSSLVNSRADLDEDKDLIEARRGSITDNNYGHDAARWEYRYYLLFI